MQVSRSYLEWASYVVEDTNCIEFLLPAERPSTLRPLCRIARSLIQNQAPNTNSLHSEVPGAESCAGSVYMVKVVNIDRNCSPAMEIDSFDGLHRGTLDVLLTTMVRNRPETTRLGVQRD